MTRTIAALGVAALALACVLARADDKKDPKADAKLTGAYTIVSGEKDGKAEPEERVKGTTVVFTEDSIVVRDKDKKETFVATYKLDSDKKPWAITMTSTVPNKGDVVKGLIEKDGDTVKLVYALPGGDVPTEFKTKDKQLLFVMKKADK